MNKNNFQLDNNFFKQPEKINFLNYLKTSKAWPIADRAIANLSGDLYFTIARWSPIFTLKMIAMWLLSWNLIIAILQSRDL